MNESGNRNDSRIVYRLLDFGVRVFSIAAIALFRIVHSINPAIDRKDVAVFFYSENILKLHLTGKV